jgi:hypothetical protein
MAHTRIGAVKLMRARIGLLEQPKTLSAQQLTPLGKNSGKV